MNSSGKIVNLVNPSSNQDAATKLYVDTQVSTASTAATSAQTTANSAVTKADSAQTKANSAYDAATAAQSTANTAVTNAASAQTKADSAATAATAAQTTANSVSTAIQGNGATASAQYLYPASGNAASILTNATHRLYVTTDGKIGMGTTSPGAKLDIDAGAGGSKADNNPGIRVSSTGTSSILMRGATGSTIKPEFELGTYNNMSYVWNYNDTPLQFGTNGAERMRIAGSEQDGNVGIGTTAPLAPLHVGRTTARNTPSYYYYLSANSEKFYSSSDVNAVNMSIICDGILWVKGSYILMTSDKRIKKNIKEIAGNDALSRIRKLRPTIYNNIDVLKDQGDLYGFIAQEVEDVITNSTKKTKDYIPNIYCKGDIFVLDASNHIYEISSENELRFEKVLDDKGSEITNYKIKIYDDTNKEYICTVINTINVNTIHVKCDKDYNFSIVEEHKNKVFIYGQEVNDFNNLDKNVIFTVATAALQEVDRQQQADKARIAELEAKVSEQQSLINDILERLKKVELA